MECMLQCHPYFYDFLNNFSALATSVRRDIMAAHENIYHRVYFYNVDTKIFL